MSKVLHLDANTLGLSNNDPVSTWTDTSATLNHGTAAGTLRPTFKTNVKNGLPALLFDGTNDVIALGSQVAITGGFTAYIVFAPTAEINAASAMTLLASTAANTFGFVYLGDLTGLTTGEVISVGRTPPAGANDFSYSTDVIAAGSWTIIAISVGAGTNGASVHLNGTIKVQTAGSTGQGPNSTSRPMEQINLIGAFTAAGGFGFAGHIAEVIIYDEALTGTAWRDVISSLATKYAITTPTLTAASVARSDVQTAIGWAVDGETVVIPAGEIGWDTQIDVTKDITIKGQTATNSVTGVCDDQTIIIDDLLDAPGGQGFFKFTTSGAKLQRLSGITFSGPGNRGTMMFNGALRWSGASEKVRIDHCHFKGFLNHGSYMMVFGPIYGVADHCVFHDLGQLGLNQINNGNGYGDLQWSLPADFGSNKFFFFEDNYNDNWGNTFSVGAGVDGRYGGKFVVRYCRFWDVEILNHGTEAGRERGGRAQEIYNNAYHWSYQKTMDGIRTGSLITHNNTYDGVSPLGVPNAGTKPFGYALQNYRFLNAWEGVGDIWGGATGNNAWDQNATEADGSHIPGNPSHLFESGTISSSASAFLVTDSTKSWTVNQWEGYQFSTTTGGGNATITSNTSTTLTVNQSGSAVLVIWQTGWNYEIRKVTIALDQPGRGAGDLIVGDTPTPAWPNQALEPCYSWNNVYTPDASTVNWIPQTYTLEEGRDFYSDTPMPGYTPYTYPHPLVSGGSTTFSGGGSTTVSGSGGTTISQ